MSWASCVGAVLLLFAAGVEGSNKKCNEAPVLIKTRNMGRGPGCWVDARCDIVYAVDRDDGMYSWDLETMKPIARMDTPDAATSVNLKGNLAFVGDGVKLHVFDIIDPTRPKYISSYDPTYGSVEYFAIDGDRLYLPTGHATYGFEILDISDPENIKMLYRHNGASESTMVAVYPSHPGTVAVVIPSTGVAFYTVADDGKSMTRKGVHPHEDKWISYSVAFSPDGAYMYTTHMANGWKVVDTTTWTDKYHFNTVEARHVHVYGDLIFLIDGMGGWKVYEMKDNGEVEFSQSHPAVAGGITTGLTVIDDIVVTSETMMTGSSGGGVAFYKMDCGLGTPTSDMEVIRIPAKAKAEALKGIHVEGRREMDGWKGPKGAVLLSNLPDAVRNGVAYFTDQAEPLDIGTKFKLKCKDTGCGKPCEFYIAVYHCPPCSASLNGRYPALLPSLGWEARSCAPQFQLASGDPKYRMVTFRKQVAAGDTVVLPATDIQLQHMAIFGVPDTVKCEAIHSRDECVADSACDWEDGKCVLHWCPRPKPGPTPPPCICP